MWRSVLWVAAFCALPVVAPAQQGATPAQQGTTLADMRQELSVIYVQIQRLRAQLSTTARPGVGFPDTATPLARINAIETEVRRLTAQVEELDFHIQRVVADGTNRIGDLEFRICEMDTGCTLSSLGQTLPLGGGDDDASGAQALFDQAVPGEGGIESTLAVAERADFERANALFDAGRFADVVSALAIFTQTYPDSPLSAQVYVLQGEAHTRQGQWQQAARAYLNAFSFAPSGSLAPSALLKLGSALGQLGQRDEACFTLSEVTRLYPDLPQAKQADAALGDQGCS